MSILSNTIKLNDYMSPALRHICTAVNQTVSTLEHMQRTMGADINLESMRNARQEISQATIYLDNYEDKIQESINKTNRLGNTSQSAFGRMTNSLRSYITTYGIAMAGKWILNTSDEMAMLNAKISMINNSLYSTSQMNQLIFQTAQNARASYTDMANTIARIQMNAGDAFGSTVEAVKFAEVLNKQFKIAGATQEETSAATLQLTQALGSGVLRGDELNSVFEAAPSILQSIADYLDVPINKIRQMAKEGQITSDVIKNAMLDPTTIAKVNEQFSSLPITWQDLWTRAINNVKFGLMETSSQLNAIANSDNMLAFVDNLAGITRAISQGLVIAIQGIAMVANFAYENWSLLAPVLTTVLSLMALYKAELMVTKGLEIAHAFWTNACAIASQLWAVATGGQTVAQLALNNALYACPLTWYVAMIFIVIGAFFLLIAILNKVTGANISAVGIICGVWQAGGAIIANVFIFIMNIASAVGIFIVNFFIASVAMIQNTFIELYNVWVYCTNGIGQRATNAGNWIAEKIASGVNIAIDAINGLISAINLIPGVNIGKMGHVQARKISFSGSSYKAYKTPNYLSFNKAPYKDVSNAFNKGYGFGANWSKDLLGKNNPLKLDKNLENMMNQMNKNNPNGSNPASGGNGGSGAGKHIKDTADNTAKIVEELKATGENIEYLRDLAEREVINRFTTAEIKIDMTNNNSISSDMDIDGVVRKLTDNVIEAMNTAAEGVHIS